MTCSFKLPQFVGFFPKTVDILRYDLEIGASSQAWLICLPTNVILKTLRQRAALLSLILCFSSTADGADALTIPKGVDGFLGNYCLSCHDSDSEEGDIRLDNLTELSLDGWIDVMNKMQEQLYVEEMPPKEETDKPSETDREIMVSWISGKLKQHNASKLEDKLRYPDYGNYVSHEKLFSGKVKDAPFTPARRWLVSPQIFNQRILDIFQLEGRDRSRQLYGITNPFILPERSGIRDYDNSLLDGGHLLVMMPNADWISRKQIRAARVKNGEIKADEFPNAKDKWAPNQTPPAIEAVILKESAPSDGEIIAAIQTQFQLVLQRPASGPEIQKYLELTNSSIGLAGNTEGLRQMLAAVLLESELLYRIEFGAGEADAHGRKKLTPHEAARSISYALGDRGPDAELQKAADEGRLATREDFDREVKRLLADKTYYAGQVDPSISGKNMRSQDASHPKLIRFFREFFGYPMAAKVFKDIERSDGYYQNLSRGTLGTAGFLIKEADRLVDYYLQRDESVFENLLTTEDYFVYHDKDNAAGQQIIEEWTEVYHNLKETNWKEDPDGVVEQHQDYLKSKTSLKFLGHGKQRREFLRHMYFWGETIGKDRTPFTTVSFAHGYTYNHSTFYNLPPTPNIFRYGNIENKNFKGLDDVEFWNYPVEQPFKLPNRKGILTHPAWLIAHSSNFHTDPIKRGRWIREKLLAGSVPDVPITVDAQIPEDHHKTLRERVEMKTQKAECWKCHERMNPLGFAFENYDDFGRFQTQEPLEHEDNIVTKPAKKNGAYTYKTKQIISTGRLDGTGDPELDGEVTDALDLIDRLAKSDRVRQSIIRHAFRYFMGRNELISDSKTLMNADQAYVKSGGSFNAVVVSLLSSDSFIYRKPISN